MLIGILGEVSDDMETWSMLTQLHRHTISHDICFENTIRRPDIVDVGAELRPTAVILADVELQVGELLS